MLKRSCSASVTPQPTGNIHQVIRCSLIKFLARILSDRTSNCSSAVFLSFFRVFFRFFRKLTWKLKYQRRMPNSAIRENARQTASKLKTISQLNIYRIARSINGWLENRSDWNLLKMKRMENTWEYFRNSIFTVDFAVGKTRSGREKSGEFQFHISQQIHQQHETLCSFSCNIKNC